MSERQRDILLIVCLCAVVVVTFWPDKNVEFMVSWDDDGNVTENPLLRKGVSEGLVPLVTRHYQSLYVPVIYAAYWAQFHLWGLDSFCFHLVNVFVHVANVLLAYLIFKRLLPGRFLSWAAALWWGVHPLNVESVAWVTGLKDMLSAFFLLVSFRSYMAWRGATSKKTGGEKWWFWGISLASFMLSCLSKPSAVAFPVALVGYDLFVTRCNWRKLRTVIPYFIFSAMIVAVTMSVQKPEEKGITPPPDIVGRLRVVGDTFLFYLGKLAWPAGLCAVYGRKVGAILSSGWSWVSLFGAGILCVIAWLFGTRWRMGAAIYIAGLAPVSGIVTFLYQGHSTVADRYVYFSSVGVALIIADMISRFGFSPVKRMNKWGIAATVLLLLWAGALGVVAKRQMKVWHDPVTLWQRVVDIKPQVEEGWCSLGVALGIVGNIDLAIKYCEHSVKLNPNYAKGYGNLGPAYNAKRKYDLAIENCTRAIELDPSYADAYINRAFSYYRKKEYDKAWSDVRQCEARGGTVDPELLEVLERDSGRTR